MCTGSCRFDPELHPTNEEGQCGEGDHLATSCSPSPVLGDTKGTVCVSPIRDGEPVVTDSDFLNEWGLPERLVNRAIFRCWPGIISLVESGVLGRLVLFTLSQGRRSVTISLRDFLDGINEDGSEFAAPDAIALTTALQAIATLQRLGLIQVHGLGSCKTFTVNAEAIINDGRAIIAQRFGVEAAAKVLW